MKWSLILLSQILKNKKVLISIINLGKKLYFNNVISALLHTGIYCLKRELKDCETVLDLGCGNNSPLQYCKIKHSVGVDNFGSYIAQSKNKNIHNEYFNTDLSKVDFPPRSFDAVILLSVVEHLEKGIATKLLDKAERIAKKKIIVATPRGFVSQNCVDGNEWQRHKSGWEIDEMKCRGYSASGLGGLKILRTTDNDCQSSSDFFGALYATVRFRPKIIWLFIVELSQMLAYYFPNLAFEVFYVKKIADIEDRRREYKRVR